MYCIHCTNTRRHGVYLCLSILPVSSTAICRHINTFCLGSLITHITRICELVLYKPINILLQLNNSSVTEQVETLHFLCSKFKGKGFKWKTSYSYKNTIRVILSTIKGTFCLKIRYLNLLGSSFLGSSFCLPFSCTTTFLVFVFLFFFEFHTTNTLGFLETTTDLSVFWLEFHKSSDIVVDKTKSSRFSTTESSTETKQLDCFWVGNFHGFSKIFTKCSFGDVGFAWVQYFNNL